LNFPLVEEKVKLIIDELELANRAYFAKDRAKLIKQKIDEAILLLDTRPIDAEGNSSFTFSLFRQKKI
jgi:hypothetical protein